MNIKAFPDLTGYAPAAERYYAIDVDSYDGAPDARSPCGTGATPEAAIADLEAQFADAEEDARETRINDGPFGVGA
jgi:hypothetical protein